MRSNLIIPLCADKPEYVYNMPYLFNFAPNGISFCIKSIQGLNLSQFDYVYFTILRKIDDKYNISELLNLQFKKLGWSRAKVVILDEPTKSQAETIYKTIVIEKIEGPLFIKDADSYFECDFTLTNGIAIFPLDNLDIVSPRNKSYVSLDDQFYLTNIIEKKIISRFFNAGGYLFESSKLFCKYYQELSSMSPLYMSHIVYSMLLDKIPFRPIEVINYQDWGNEQMYNYFTNSNDFKK